MITVDKVPTNQHLQEIPMIPQLGEIQFEPALVRTKHQQIVG